MSVIRTQLRGFASRPARPLLTGLAVLVAAFVVYATVLAKQVTERSLVAVLSETPPATSAVVDADKRPLTPDELAAVRAVPGVAEAAGRLRGALVPATHGSTVDISQLVDLTADPGSGPLSRVRLVSGAYPHGPGEIAVTKRTADRSGWRLGDRISVVPLGGSESSTRSGPPDPATVLVTGIVDGSGSQAAYAPDQVVAGLLHSGYERIDVRAVPGTSTDVLVAALSAHLSGGVAVKDARTVEREEAERAARETSNLFALVAVFVAIAVGAAALVATSTFRIAFAQRMRQLALLRAVGAGRGRLAFALTVEGAATGLLTGTVGVLAALGIVHALVYELHRLGARVEAPGYPVGAAVAVVLGAAVVSVGAVLAPAFSASAVSPLEALRTSATTAARRGIGWFRLVFGLLLALAAAGIAGLVFAAAKPNGGEPLGLMLAVVGSGALAFGALIALGPVLIRPVLRIVGWPVRRGGPVGALAVSGVGGAPRRAAAVSVVVALGAALIAGTLVGSASLRSLLEAQLSADAPADINVTAGENATLPAGLADRLRKRSEFTRVVPYRDVEVTAEGSRDTVRAVDVDLRALPSARQIGTASGSLVSVAPGGVAIGSSYAQEAGRRVGDTIRLTAGGHTVSVKVVAVLAGSGPLYAEVVADRADLDRLGATGPTGVLADIAGSDERSRTAAVTAVRTELGGPASIDVLADRRDEDNKLFTVVVAIALGLLSLTVLVAVTGVGTTTALSVVERVNESGLLRAVGLSRGGLRAALTTEAGLYGLVGSALGLALGVPYAWLLLRALSLDAPLPVRVPVVQLGVLAAALALLTALAGLLPAWRAARVSPITALGAE
jgi:putative ABC transport system permease protein